MPDANHERYEFGGYRLNVGERLLERTDGSERIALPDKAFDTLCVLVRNAGHLVGKEEILRSVWADCFVEENNLNKSIHAIRRALGDQNGEPRFVETVKKHGFRFIADVTAAEIDSGRNGSIGADGNGHPIARERSADGILSRPLLLSVAVIICAAAGAGFYSWFAPASQAPKEFSILVLPVQPLDTNGGGDEVLRLGIADALIQRLNGTEGVVVRSLSETRRYAGADQEPLAAGRVQQVDYVLASTYQSADGKFRVTGQLINVATGRVEETLRSEIDLAGKFAMQDAVAGDLSTRILKRFGTAPGNLAPNRGTSNEEAYAAYLQGMDLLERAETDGQSARQAIAAFDRAIALDPNYAAAWAGKGHAHCANSHINASPPDEEYKVAEPALQRALELDPNNAEAHVVIGFIMSDYRWDWEQGEKYLRRAVEIAPTLDYAHRWYGFLLVRAGRVDDGLAQMREAMRLNPSSIQYRFNYGLALFQGGRLDEAQAQLERLSEIAPDLDNVYGLLWQIHHRKGDGERAYENLRKYLVMQPDGAAFIGPVESAYRSGGWPAALSAHQKQRVAKLPEGYWPGHYFMATLSVYAGDREQAFRSLEDALKYRLYDVPFMRIDPALEPIRSDPKFADLVRRSGVK